jgi:hypothetical protein
MEMGGPAQQSGNGPYAFADAPRARLHYLEEEAML